MLVVILLYDQLLFRPLVAWADRFRFEQEAGVAPPRSWVLNVLRRSGIVAGWLARPAAAIGAGPTGCALVPLGQGCSETARAPAA